jgi:hypothetical protein
MLLKPGTTEQPAPDLDTGKQFKPVPHTHNDPTQAVQSMDIDWRIVKILPTDYTDYGGEVERWKDRDDYPDCSCGCKWFAKLEGDLGYDWGVCTKVDSARAGMLTWEHQTGKDCFEQ